MFSGNSSCSNQKQDDDTLISNVKDTIMYVPQLDWELCQACASHDVESVRTLLKTDAYKSYIELSDHNENESADHNANEDHAAQLTDPIPLTDHFYDDYFVTSTVAVTGT